MKKVERYCYPAIFSYEEGEEISVLFPDLDVATSGVNDDDALLSARELLGCVMYGLEEDEEEIDVSLDETREYDINAILERARSEKEVDYEKELTEITSIVGSLGMDDELKQAYLEVVNFEKTAYQAYKELGEAEKALEMKTLWLEERKKIDAEYPYLTEEVKTDVEQTKTE